MPRSSGRFVDDLSQCDLYTTEVPGIVQEAQAKLRGHRKQKLQVKRSLLTETASNVVFFSLAYALDFSNIEWALVGAAAVYVPLTYKFRKASNHIKSLEAALSDFAKSHDTRVFDHLGLTFRGNRPLGTADEHEPFFTLQDTIAPLKNFSILRNAFNCARYNLHDLFRPVFKAAKRIKTCFWKSANAPARQFLFMQDPCSALESTVMRTKLPYVNNSAVVQMPADLDRIKTSLQFTKGSLRSDYCEIGMNAIGIAGATEFCIVVGAEAAKNFTVSAQTMNPLSAILGLTWAVTDVVALTPLNHLLHDGEVIHNRVRAKDGIIDVKKDGIASLSGMESPPVAGMIHYQPT